jgi:peptidoglycan/xylan/chitin deacetylase (PgdA/CDA1 family)
MITVSASQTRTWDPTLNWDFECHSHTHPHLSQLTLKQVRLELEQVNAAFQAHGYPTPQHHAYPYGDMNEKVKAIVAKYRKSGRMVSGNMETHPVLDWHELKAAEFRRGVKVAEAKTWVDDCIKNNALLVIYTHEVKEKPTYWGTRIKKLTELLDYIVEKRDAGLLTVMTMAEAYDYWTTAKKGKATVVISFDDGWATDYINVYPLFKERGLKGTSFIPTGLIGKRSRLTWEKIAKMRAGT